MKPHIWDKDKKLKSAIAERTSEQKQPEDGSRSFLSTSCGAKLLTMSWPFPTQHQGLQQRHSHVLNNMSTKTSILFPALPCALQSRSICSISILLLPTTCLTWSLPWNLCLCLHFQSRCVPKSPCPFLFWGPTKMMCLPTPPTCVAF